MVNLLGKLGQENVVKEAWLKKDLLTGPSWKVMKFVDLFHKRSDSRHNIKSDDCIRPSTVPGKRAMYGCVYYVGFKVLY